MAHKERDRKHHTQQVLPPSALRTYTGGHSVIYGGYIYELCPDHRDANPFGFVKQHRLVVERQVGCYLAPGIQVHHIDGVKTNNSPDNLHACTRSEHMSIHREEMRLRFLAPLTEESVKQALLTENGSVTRAAQLLGVHYQTLLNRFPDLVAPYKRRSPTKIDDPTAIAKILAVAPDDRKGYRQVAAETGISFRTVQRICERNGIVWTRKSKKGEIHRTYRRKPSILPPSERRGSPYGPVDQPQPRDDPGQ